MNNPKGIQAGFWARWARWARCFYRSITNLIIRFVYGQWNDVAHLAQRGGPE